jgi:SNF2 family DNA or RNA helicase
MSSNDMEILKNAMQRVKTGLRGRLIVPYQAQGVIWMLKREMVRPKYPGGILADEMGLGKTIETIATMIGNPQPTTLIVVPKAVITQWIDACVRFMGVQPHVITSSTCPKLASLKPDDLRDHKIVLTTYPTVSGFDRGKNQVDNPFHGVDWSRLICDEVHVIKNHKSKVWDAVTKIEAPIRWGLTGTPVIRNLREFANLMLYVGAVALTKESLMRMSRTYVLRRTKEDVARITERLRLPPLDIRLVSTPFRTPEERQMYDDLIEEGRLRLRTMHAQGQTEDNTHMHMLETILRLRQLVVNPHVLVEGLRRKADADADADADEVPAWTGGCTKLDLLMELIREQPKNEKTLIFCHWIGEMNAIEKRLRDFGGVGRLEGSMSTDDRNKTIEEFMNHDLQFLIVQIDCGGVGLNLQVATRVYINSLHWNAANELQAIGRTHRTGQTQKVVVTRLVIEDTIDEYIIQKQGGKLKIAAETLNDPRLISKLDDSGGVTFRLTRKDILKIFSNQ